MTIVPLNPENIQKYYGETTYAGWKESVAKVNAYIRTKPYIDTAAPSHPSTSCRRNLPWTASTATGTPSR